MSEQPNCDVLLQIIFDLKNEFSSFKTETNKKINKMQNTIDIQKEQLDAKDNEIKQLNYTIDDLKANHANVIIVLNNDIKDLKNENRKLKKEINQKNKEIRQLKNRIDKLEKENTKLKNQNAKNSSNSSKPSSTDGFSKVAHSLRLKSDKKVGGQKNHDGHILDKSIIDKMLDSKKKI